LKLNSYFGVLIVVRTLVARVERLILKYII